MSIPRTALITGGSLRIGKSISEGLSAAGYAIAVHYHSSSDDADILVDEIEAAGGKALAVEADLTSSAATPRAHGQSRRRARPHRFAGQQRLDL